MTSQTPSHACCTVPPVVTSDYKEKGNFITVDGLKTYATGPSSAKRGLLVVYDIFGFFPQTLQGADILATGDHEKQYQVFMPDLFDGKPADISWYPPDTKEKGDKLGNFFNTTAAPPQHLERIPKIVKELAQSHGIESWALLGYCWGGKIANLLSQGDSLFKAAASVHPAMVDPQDAPKISIPFAMLPSGDEDKEAVEKHKDALKAPGIVEWFPTQVHGWMAARSDLSDENVKKEYERGYKVLLDFYHEYM